MPDKPKDARRIWPISLAIHLVLLGVIFFIPAKEYFEADREKRTPKPPEIKRRGEDLERVMEKVRDITAERLAQKVALLDQGEERMYTNFETLNAHHQPMEEQQRATALDRMAAFAERTLTQMNALRTQLNEALEKDSPAAIVAALDESEPLGSRILVGQEEIRRGLMFVAPDDPTLVQAQTEAEEAQISSVEFLGWGLGSVRGYVNHQERIPRFEEDLSAAKSELAQIEEREAEVETRRQNLRDKLNELRKQERQGDLSDERKQAIAKEKEQTEQRKTEVDENFKNIRDDRRQQEREITQLERQLENTQNKVANSDRSWEKHLPVARNTQNAAFYKQRDVVNALLEKAGKEPIFEE